MAPEMSLQSLYLKELFFYITCLGNFFPHNSEYACSPYNLSVILKINYAICRTEKIVFYHIHAIILDE